MLNHYPEKPKRDEKRKNDDLPSRMYIIEILVILAIVAVVVIIVLIIMGPIVGDIFSEIITCDGF